MVCIIDLAINIPRRVECRHQSCLAPVAYEVKLGLFYNHQMNMLEPLLTRLFWMRMNSKNNPSNVKRSISLIIKKKNKLYGTILIH